MKDFDTKDTKHIDESNQEYIAEGNRMTEEIRLTTEVLNCDYFNRNRGFNCYKGKNCTEAPDCYYKQLKRLETENAELKAENERLKAEFRIESLTDKTTGETNYRSNLVNKYRTILQEIMVIAEAPSPYIDNFEIKTATEVGYDYAAICNELELRLHKVLELITKAEEE